MKAAPWGNICDDVLSQRREERSHTLHKQRIRDTKPLVDCSTPSTSRLSITRNSKQKQLKDDKLQEIQLENERLNDKLKAMFRKRQKGNEDIKVKPQEQPLMKGEALFCKSSLNEYARKEEHKRIKDENKILNDRIRGEKCIKSDYSRQDMARNEEQRKKYLHNLSKVNRRRHVANPLSEQTSDVHNNELSHECVPQSLINDVKKENTTDFITISNKQESKIVKLKTVKQIKDEIVRCGLFDDIILREASLPSLISSSTLRAGKRGTKARPFILHHIGNEKMAA